ncbi:MAG: 23S rRNA (uracil(1939)-C(5))-methyltransferase RlmD [Eubacteriales bacterium]|nr:23S rRNA (uracil(1939)-C(5))-methyltransferase RlmD [Eubacteriales bacterium]
MDIAELKKNELYTVVIDGYSSEALGVCRIGGRAVFVPKTLVGEEWKIRIVKVTSTAVYGKAEELIKCADERRVSECPYYGKCGGCDTLHMSYEGELGFKLDKVNNALTHIGKQTVKADGIIGADTYLHYRNKGIMAVADVNGRPRAGFFRERSHDLIVIDDCLIQNDLCAKAARAVTQFMERYSFPAYDELKGRGNVRNIFCRRAYHGNDAVVCVVSAKGFGAHTEKLVAFIRNNCPEVTGIVLNINKSRGNTVLDGEFYTLFGDPDMTDTLCDLRFDISPRAFFQINPPQAEKLYMKALEYAAVTREDTVLDLYCGAGTISLCLAGRAGKVIGAEIVPQAIENARENAEKNGIENAEFICADAGQAAVELKKRGVTPKVVVVDPPRKGMSEDAVKAVASMEPERVVYVSCNPATLARDISVFNSCGYELEKATAVDMFPRTSHVETIVLMSRA